MKITIEARLGCSPLTGDGINVQISARRNEMREARDAASALASSLIGILASSRRAARDAAMEAELQNIAKGEQS